MRVLDAATSTRMSWALRVMVVDAVIVESLSQAILLLGTSTLCYKKVTYLWHFESQSFHSVKLAFSCFVYFWKGTYSLGGSIISSARENFSYLNDEPAIQLSIALC